MKNIKSVEKNTIGGISKLLNISSSSIRKYQEKGILDFEIDNENSYRYFNLFSFNKLLRYLFYRKCGFTSKQGSDLLNCSDLSVVSKSYETRILEVEKEIERQILLKQRLLECYDKVNSIENDLNKPKEVICPKLYYTCHYQSEEIQYENKDNIKSMVANLPYVNSSPVFRMDSLNSLEYGLVIEDKYINQDMLLNTLDVIEPQKCIHIFIMTDAEHYLTIASLEKVYEYASKNNYCIKKFLGRTIACIRSSSNKPIRYHEFWAIIE